MKKDSLSCATFAKRLVLMRNLMLSLRVMSTLSNGIFYFLLSSPLTPFRKSITPYDFFDYFVSYFPSLAPLRTRDGMSFEDWLEKEGYPLKIPVFPKNPLKGFLVRKNVAPRLNHCRGGLQSYTCVGEITSPFR